MSSEMVTLTIDGKEVTVPKGMLIIRAAEELGIEIPRFCDHPLLEPVAACRQCYVKVEGQRKLMTSCSTPVAQDMVVLTQFTDEEVKEAQEAVLEFLLINHPLDCPICDRGGECPLQDQALAYGPGESRYIEAKRTYRKPLPLSPLVNLDRERCVLCARCTRFCDQISGDRFIELFERGAAEQVGIAPGEDFRSPFSGNTIQICPVGALTATTYRFAARPFDIKWTDSICPHCACGCNLRVDTRRGEVVRHLARDNYDVNDSWLCDKGRFAFSYPDQPSRLRTPLLREHGLEPVSFGEAFEAIAGWSREGGKVAFLAGGRLSDEDAFALSKLARSVFGTNDIDHRTGGFGVPLDIERAQASGMPVTYQQVERARVIVVAGLDAEQELPILHLRIRKAARKGAKVFVVHPRRTRLWDVAEHILCLPGAEAEVLGGLSEQGADTLGGRLMGALGEAAGAAVVLAGPRLGDADGAVEAAAALAAGAGAAFGYLCRRANDRGALQAGVHPALLPGGRSLDDPVGWDGVPAEPGRDAAAILQAAANREYRTLFLVGVDPVRDFPDAKLAAKALSNTEHVIVVDIDETAIAKYADVMLPAAPVVEKDAHYTDWEGRSQRFHRARNPQSMATAEWEIFQALSEAMGRDMGFRSIDDLHEEMGALYAGGGGVAEARSAGRPGEAQPRGGESPPPEQPAPTTDGDKLILFTYPLLVDEGRLSQGAETLKEALGEEPFVELNPADAERLKIGDGARVRLATNQGGVELPARVTPGIAEGAVFVPWNQPGFAANTLLAGISHEPATAEPVNAEVPA